MPAKLMNDPDFNDAIPKPTSGRRPTLVELVVVLGIIGLLIALLSPANRCNWPVARRAHCANNLKQIALASLGYEQAHNALPPAYTMDASGRPLHSWRTLILPFLEQEHCTRRLTSRNPGTTRRTPRLLKPLFPFFDVLRRSGHRTRRPIWRSLLRMGA